MIIVRRETPGAAAAALAAAGLPPVLARIYAARGITSPAELDCGLAALPPFGAMLGIDRAAERLARAITRRERIVIVADYDADGATACAVGIRGLRALGAEADFLVPNRFEFGYGLTPEIVAVAAAMRPDLLITVDNGIASLDGVAAAAARGIDVLVTDHHLPGATLPAPAIIVDPNQPGCTFASKNIAGVGVMFYVLTALRARLRGSGALPARGGPHLASLLDLVALGTIADVVPLDRVNRILVRQGLDRIRAGRATAGIAALFDAAGRDTADACVADLGYAVGPRLNAAGRLADMSLGIRCLLAEDAEEARGLAAKLDRLNRERREVEASMHEDAQVLLAATGPIAGDAATLCLHQPQWHQGVVGILASRLKDRYHRPTVIFAAAQNGELRGSGRSIDGFHLRDAIDLVAKRVPGAVLRFGGHAHAAGLSITPAALADFAAAFEAVARELLDPSGLQRQLDTDGELAAGELTLELCAALRDGVWGRAFPPPAFDGVFDVLSQRSVGAGHAKLELGRGGERYDAIAFRQPLPVPARIRGVYRPEISRWKGFARIQLVLDDCRAA
ncbi:MAG: single-stranded-DNA-specific exonuclease RecJ [Proteobacteria bacterium]|jgi:single-stranded-DNA-specific exonuclease|nr:single-stranded-DNA-specific exonuclease RecJ [Pseudomonadota bacterium]